MLPQLRRLSLGLCLVAFLSSRCFAADDLVIPDSVVFEKGIEYSNPDDQHLQVNLARASDLGEPSFALLLNGYDRNRERFCRQLHYRNGAVSCDALRGSGAIDDW